MSTDQTIRDANKKSPVQTIPAVLIVAIGLVLMIGKMYVDSEPGAIPLLMVVLGTGWYLVARARARSHHE